MICPRGTIAEVNSIVVFASHCNSFENLVFVLFSWYAIMRVAVIWLQYYAPDFQSQEW